MSLHFNAFSNPQANGATALYYITNKRTKEIASEFAELMAENFCVKRRELIAISSKKQRGGTFIVKCKSDAVLIEPFFGTNPKDAYAFKDEHKKLAENLRSLINKYSKR